MKRSFEKLDASIDELASKGAFDPLGSLLAADFRYNHSTGHSQSKSAWLAGLTPLLATAATAGGQAWFDRTWARHSVLTG